MGERELKVYRYSFPTVKDGKFVIEHRERIVRVLARAEGWAMCRPKGLATFCCMEKELFPLHEDAASIGGKGDGA